MVLMDSNGLSRRGILRLVAGAGATLALAGGLRGPLAVIAQTGAANTQRVSTDLLNLREGPGLSYPVIATLPTGTEVAADAAQRQAAGGVNWIAVTVVSTGVSGWVDSQYLGEAAAGTELGTKWVSVADANLRSGAGLSHDIVTTLPLGQEVAITGVSSDADGLTWYPVTAGAASGWMANIVLTDTQPSAFAQGTKVTVNTDLLNLRFDPGTAADVLGTYAFGTVGTIVSASGTEVEGATWHQVEIDGDGKVGWFIETYITAAPGGGTAGRVKVADGPLNLRQAPGLAGEVVAEVATGATATLIGNGQTAADGHQWINVRLEDQSGREGWVASEFVSFL